MEASLLSSWKWSRQRMSGAMFQLPNSISAHPILKPNPADETITPS
jgi:hypothetical protein